MTFNRGSGVQIPLSPPLNNKKYEVLIMLKENKDKCIQIAKNSLFAISGIGALIGVLGVALAIILFKLK